MQSLLQCSLEAQLGWCQQRWYEVFSSLQSAAPGVMNNGLGGDRHLVLKEAASLTLSLAILTGKNLHGLCSCLQVRPVASSNITVTSTSF